MASAISFSREKRGLTDSSVFFSQLKAMVENKTDILKVSDRLNVNPSTVQKILKGRPISRSVKKKIDAAFTQGLEPNPAEPKYSTIDRLWEVYHLYEQAKSLRAVGREMGVSQERVRQLLERGDEVGLYKYKPLRTPVIPRGKILSDYKKLLKLNAVARSNGISISYLSKLIELHRISEEELRTVQTEGRKVRCLRQYHLAAQALGHHPTTTELQRDKTTRNLLYQVRRLWGSFEAFRKELQTARPITVPFLKEAP